MAVADVASAGLLAWLLVRHGVPRPRAAAVWTAAVMLAQLTAGRASFTLGLVPALGCVAAASDVPPWRAARWVTVASLGLVCGLLSPVAALFLGVPAAALLLTGRRREGLVLGLAAALPVGATALVPGEGTQPVGPQTWIPPLVSAVAVLLLVPARWRAVRAGALVYGLGVLAVWAVPTPVGSNAERLGLLLTGPLLAGLGRGSCPPALARLGRGSYRLLLAGLGRGSYRLVLAGAGRSSSRLLLTLALVAAGVWLAAQPADDLLRGNAPPYAPQTAGLVRELRLLRAGTARVEAVPQYGHWESQELASAVWLARGWERQLDMARNPLFYSGVLTSARYHTWLRLNSVRYVAISGGPLDWASTAEAALVRAGQPWLVPVWHDAFWRLYRVAGTAPLATPPGTVVSTSPAAFSVQLTRPGTTVVRVHWSPLLRASGGARLARHGPWTALTAVRAGTYSVTAPY
jgi:hypothetical protein